MNGGGEMLKLLQAVLGMAAGEQRALRESHLPALCTVHRYHDGWYVAIDYAIDTEGYDRPLLGWRFTNEQDMTHFLLGDLGGRICHFAWIGEL